MARHLSIIVTFALFLNVPGLARAADKEAATPNVDAALQRGAEYLLGTQAPNGSWGKHPAITALAVMAIYRVEGVDRARLQRALDRGMAYMLSFVQKDGSVFPADRDMKRSANYPNYTTSLVLLAMATVHRPQDVARMRAARRYLQESQFSDPSKVDFGGIGYGRTGRADLSNGSLAAEALFFTDYLDQEPFSQDPAAQKRTQKMWRNLQTFLTKCQNLPETNKQPYVSHDPADRGGFIYRPNESKAGSRDETGDGRSGLISSGSMTYAGLKSMVYAQLDKEDVRVKGAIRYLLRNYTLSENPGMGAQGLYYYLHTMTKALQAYGEDTLRGEDGTVRHWRRDVIARLLQLQKTDGSWVNENARYFETMPDLVTPYAMIALKIAAGRADLVRK